MDYLESVIGISKDMFVTMVAGPTGRQLPVFDKPDAQTVRKHFRKLPRKKRNATHVLKRDWTYYKNEIYVRGTLVNLSGTSMAFLDSSGRDYGTVPGRNEK